VLKLFDPFSELGKLVGSTRRKVEGIRQQDDGAALECGRQAKGFFAADRELEVRDLIADSQC
jgi:hypothetical protein